MAVHLLMRVTFLLLLTHELAEATPPMAKPSCTSSCGNLSIPYPFGIEPGCYMDPWFEIYCEIIGNNSAQAFLGRNSWEVRQININDGTVQVQMPIIYWRYCNVRPTGMEGNMSMSLKGSPFHFSGSYNTFISVGCDNFATVSGIAPTVFGCISDCNINMNIREANVSNCTGFMCCESTNVPSNLQEFAVDFRTISESTERSENCKFAFLVVKDWLLSNNSVRYSGDVPVVLEWAILKQTKNSLEMIRSLKYRHDVICNFSNNTFHCACASGYEGNPYLSTGCEGTHTSNFA